MQAYLIDRIPAMVECAERDQLIDQVAQTALQPISLERTRILDFPAGQCLQRPDLVRFARIIDIFGGSCRFWAGTWPALTWKLTRWSGPLPRAGVGGRQSSPSLPLDRALSTSPWYLNVIKIANKLYWVTTKKTRYSWTPQAEDPTWKIRNLSNLKTIINKEYSGVGCEFPFIALSTRII